MELFIINSGDGGNPKKVTDKDLEKLGGNFNNSNSKRSKKNMRKKKNPNWKDLVKEFGAKKASWIWSKKNKKASKSRLKSARSAAKKPKNSTSKKSSTRKKNTTRKKSTRKNSTRKTRRTRRNKTTKRRSSRRRNMRRTRRNKTTYKSLVKDFGAKKAGWIWDKEEKKPSNYRLRVAKYGIGGAKKAKRSRKYGKKKKTGKGWHGAKSAHSEAAKLGWRRRKKGKKGYKKAFGASFSKNPKLFATKRNPAPAGLMPSLKYNLSLLKEAETYKNGGIIAAGSITANLTASIARKAISNVIKRELPGGIITNSLMEMGAGAVNATIVQVATKNKKVSKMFLYGAFAGGVNNLVRSFILPRIFGMVGTQQETIQQEQIPPQTGVSGLTENIKSRIESRIGPKMSGYLTEEDIDEVTFGEGAMDDYLTQDDIDSNLLSGIRDYGYEPF